MTNPANSTQPQALILFAHGSRDPDWARPLHGLRDAVAALCPQLPVTLAFLEFMEPTLTQVIAQLASESSLGESGASSQPLQPLQRTHAVSGDAPGDFIQCFMHMYVYRHIELVGHDGHDGGF